MCQVNPDFDTPSSIGGDGADSVLEGILVDGAGLDFGTIGVDGGDAGAEDVGNLLVVGDAEAQEGKDAKFGGEACAIVTHFELVAGNHQAIDFADEVGEDVEECRIEILVEEPIAIVDERLAL